MVSGSATAAGARRYRPILELGRGGMSRVFLCVSSGVGGFNKLLVVKTLLPDLASDPEFLKMFLEEARLSARLNHPNIVQINEVGFENDQHFMAMEFLDGQSLEGVVRRAASKGGMPLELHLRVLIEAAIGLHYAHELAEIDGSPLRIVHRDVSPHNVFVTYQGQVKVVDFGIAKAADSSQQTRTGVLKGKCTYMAPEQFKGSKYVDRRADIFALGVMTWQAAAKKRLWSGMSDIEIFQRLSTGKIDSPLTIDPQIPGPLVDIVMKALAIKPEERFQTAGDFADALEGFLRTTGKRAGSRELSTYTTALFTDRRAKVQAVIEKALNRAPPESSSDVLMLSDQVSPMSGEISGMHSGQYSQSAHHSQSGAYGSGSAPPPVSAATRVSASDIHRPDLTLGSAATQFTPVTAPAASKGPLFVAVGALAVAILGAAIIVTRKPDPAPEQLTTPPPPTTQPTQEPSTTSTSATATDADFIELHLAAQPREAVLYLDNAPLESNPATVRVPRDSRKHEIRAMAQGYDSRAELISYDEAVKNISLALGRSSGRR